MNAEMIAEVIAKPSRGVTPHDLYLAQMVLALFVPHFSALREAESRLREAGTMHRNGGFYGDNIDRWLNTVELMTVPLIRAALSASEGLA